MLKRFCLLILIALSASSASAQRIYRFYELGDWVSYTDTRYITSIARGFKTIYFGTTGGILRYDMYLEKWLDPITVSDGMPDNRVRRLAVDKLTDEIWIDTPSATSYFNPTFAEWRNNENFRADKVQNPNVSMSDLPQLIPAMGFTYYPKGLLVDQYLMQYPITQMLKDDNGMVWMGLSGLGAAKADIRRADLKLLRFGPFDADIARLDKDGDDFWFLGGTAGLPGTITHFDRSASEWEYFEPRRQSGIISDQFYSIAHDKNSIWIGTELGLVQFDKRSQAFRSYSHFDGIYGDRVNAILPIENNLLIGTDQGVSVFDLKRDSIYSAVSDNIRGKSVNDFALLDKTIYAATQYGIYTLTWGTGNWKRFELPSFELKGSVVDIQIVDSTLYSASDDGVVVVNLRDNTFKVYDLNNKFHGSPLNVLTVYQGIIWVGADNGLYRLNPRTGNWYQYTADDGLIGTKITSIVGDGDYVWIATDQGASRFHWKVYDRRDWLE